MSKAFAFKLCQRVNVPGKKGVQGIVAVPNADEIGGLNGLASAEPSLPVYFVRWLNDVGAPMATWFGQAEMIAANLAIEVAGTIGEGGRIDPVVAAPAPRKRPVAKRRARRTKIKARRKSR